MPTLASVGHGKQTVPVDPILVAPQKQKQIAQPEQSVKDVVKREMDTEIEEQKLAPEDRQGASSQVNLVEGAPCLIPAEEGARPPARPQGIPIEVLP